MYGDIFILHFCWLNFLFKYRVATGNMLNKRIIVRIFLIWTSDGNGKYGKYGHKIYFSKCVVHCVVNAVIFIKKTRIYNKI